ncbi:trypsin-like peptidase domain-containing protein [Desulfoplanes formicivorans]|uniref:trypsin-like peptidase domain-containing protein n=1 Tax=Desulfoplanes formicivorans TaxID=1592317 RepID=UPI0009F6F8BF|nr:trypsin-like peptidase domain-containing protein [Desulfoplanes formicivorans]
MHTPYTITHRLPLSGDDREHGSGLVNNTSRCLGLIVFVALFLILPMTVQARENLRMTPVVRAVQAVAPAVVNIHTSTLVEQQVNPFGGLFGGDLFEHFFPGPGITRQYEQTSLGSGVVIDAAKRLVLTNAHVISGASSIMATFLDGRQYKADLVGSDPDFDVAILRLEGSDDLPQVVVGDSSDILIGETVIAIGNPYGFSNTVTTGVVSAVHRTIKTKHGTFTDFIQTDAAINPGNSGGPLLNRMGELIGVNTAIYAEAQGIGFAIPINKAKRVIAELLSHGRVDPVWLGIRGQDVDQRIARYFGLSSVGGLLVSEVYAGSPAERAGLHPGDVLLKIGRNPVTDKQGYLDLMRNFTRDQDVRLEVLSEGATKTVTARAEIFEDDRALQLAYDVWGLEVGTRFARKQLVVTRIRSGSPADRLGLERGDVILKIAGQPVNEPKDFARAFKRYRMQNSLILLVARGRQGYYARLTIQ